MNTPDIYSHLASHGFERITRWALHNDTIKLESLAWKETAGWIYAFVSQNRIRYVGITTMVLRSRMDNYSHLVGDRVRPLICSCLQEGHGVEIYGIRRPKIAKVDLESEESGLIREFKTDWNVKE
jgi:hypothetical protein